MYFPKWLRCQNNGIFAAIAKFIKFIKFICQNNWISSLFAK